MEASKIKSARGRSPLRASQAVRKAFLERGKRPGHLVFFYASKADRDWVLPSGLEYAAVLFVEASQDFASYTCDPDVIWSELSAGGFKGSRPDIRVQPYAGQRALWEIKYSEDIKRDPRAHQQKEIQERAAQELGYGWRWFTEADAVSNGISIMNWLSIRAALEACRALETRSLQDEIRAFVQETPELQVSDIYREFSSFRKATFVALMRAHQQRKLTVDVASRPFALTTSVRPWSAK